MADSHSNGKNVYKSSSSPYKRTMDRPLCGIALFGPKNELFGEMKNRLKLRSTKHSDIKELSSEISTNNTIEHQEPSSYDNTSSSMSANSSPRSSIYDDFEQSESKTISDILLNRARKPPTRKPTLNRCSNVVPNKQSSTSIVFHPNNNTKLFDGLTEFFNTNN